MMCGSCDSVVKRVPSKTYSPLEKPPESAQRLRFKELNQGINVVLTQQIAR